MEGVLTLVAGWVSQREIGVLQRVSMMMSVNVNEWVHKDIIEENERPGEGQHDRKMDRSVRERNSLAL